MDVKDFDESHEFDLVVIGGGCVGTAIAMLGSRAGLDVALVEKDDFGSKTSAASSEMIHGGLQYLAKLQFSIVRKSNQYAGRIMSSARHLVEPLAIVFPYYQGGPVSGRALRLLLRTYERYNTRFKHAPPGQPLNAQQIVDRIPLIRSEGLMGGTLYYEWGIDAPRMCLTNAMWAAEQGAWVRNHTQVVGFERQNERIVGIWVDDERTGRRALIRGKMGVNATGPWADRLCELAKAGGGPHIRPTKGVHLFLPRCGDTGLILHFIDDRFGFMISRGPYSLIGTTDDDYYGLLDHGLVTRDEVGYLLQGAQRFLPGLSQDDIVDTKWGVRPTAFAYGQIEDKVNRDHRIVDHEEYGTPGFWSIYGGKLATHTWMAEDLLSRVFKKLGRVYRPIESYQLPGGPDKAVSDYIDEVAPAAASRYGLHVEDVASVIRRYGTRHEDVLDLIEEDPNLRQNLCRCTRNGQPVRRVLAAEVLYGVQHEMALTLADIGRRTGLDTGLCNRNRCLDQAGQLLRSRRANAVVA